MGRRRYLLLLGAAGVLVWRRGHGARGVMWAGQMALADLLEREARRG